MPTNQIKGFAAGDIIDLAGVNFVQRRQRDAGGRQPANVVENGTTFQLHLDPAQNFAG